MKDYSNFTKNEIQEVVLYDDGFIKDDGEKIRSYEDIKSIVENQITNGTRKIENNILLNPFLATNTDDVVVINKDKNKNKSDLTIEPLETNHYKRYKKDGTKLYVGMALKDKIESWTGKAIGINAGMECGKTHFILHDLQEYAEQNNKNILFLYNRRPLGIKLREETKRIDNIKVMAYQTVQDFINRNDEEKINLDSYDYIVCDEAHYIFNDVFNKRTIYIYEELIKRIKEKKSTVIFMTATGNELWNTLINEEEILDINNYYYFEPSYRHIKKLYVQSNNMNDDVKLIDEMLEINTNLNKKDRYKAIIFVEDKKEQFQLIQHFRAKFKDRKVWGVKFSNVASFNDKEANEYAKEFLKDDVLQDISFDCECLITTKILDNGYEFKDARIKIVSTRVFDINSSVQCIGRTRESAYNENDGLVVFVTNYNNAKIKAQLNSTEKKIDIIEECIEDETKIDEYKTKWCKDCFYDKPIAGTNRTNAEINMLAYRKFQYDKKLYDELIEINRLLIYDIEDNTLKSLTVEDETAQATAIKFGYSFEWLSVLQMNFLECDVLLKPKSRNVYKLMKSDLYSFMNNNKHNDNLYNIFDMYDLFNKTNDLLDQYQEIIEYLKTKKTRPIQAEINKVKQEHETTKNKLDKTKKRKDFKRLRDKQREIANLKQELWVLEQQQNELEAQLEEEKESIIKPDSVKKYNQLFNVLDIIYDFPFEFSRTKDGKDKIYINCTNVKKGVPKDSVSKRIWQYISDEVETNESFTDDDIINKYNLSKAEYMATFEKDNLKKSVFELYEFLEFLKVNGIIGKGGKYKKTVDNIEEMRKQQLLQYLLNIVDKKLDKEDQKELAKKCNFRHDGKLLKNYTNVKEGLNNLGFELESKTERPYFKIVDENGNTKTIRKRVSYWIISIKDTTEDIIKALSLMNSNIEDDIEDFDN